MSEARDIHTIRNLAILPWALFLVVLVVSVVLGMIYVHNRWPNPVAKKGNPAEGVQG